jgi:hypothetical protein
VAGLADRVCVSTITWARDEFEEALLRRSLRELSRHGLPVVVADKGASRTFSEFLTSHSEFVVAPPGHASLVGQVQAGLTAAARTGAEFILYTESDKALFFQAGLETFLQAADLRPDTGVVLAARSDESFATFPKLQRFTERTINELCAEATGVPGDYSFGPFIMNRQLASLVGGLRPEVGWGWRHFVFATAPRRGYTVRLVSGHYPCPPDQVEDERIHRLRQLSQNIDGLVESLKAEAEERLKFEG